MDIVTKILAFEYMLTQLRRWGEEMNPRVLYTSFTRLKALKLLFFIAAVKNNEGEDLLDVFDNFYALPNGPVESDVYNSITSDALTYYTFKDFSLGTKNAYDVNSLDESLRRRIDSAIAILRSKNEKIITYSAEQLVSLSHCWWSWQNSMQMARAFGKGSYRMSASQIRNNTQIFAI